MIKLQEYNTMKSPPTFFILFHLVFLLSNLFFRSTKCQLQYAEELYIGDQGIKNCSSKASISKGYPCNRPQTSCTFYVTFRSQPPYDTPLSISNLLGAEPSDVASFNTISTVDDKIPTYNLIVVPVNCLCSGNIYQHLASYRANGHQNYSMIAEAYQGLSTCQALMGQNYYGNEENVAAGTELMVPVRCACPTENQTRHGVTSLLTYAVMPGENLTEIAKQFGSTVVSLVEANMLVNADSLQAFSFLLVPISMEGCRENPKNLMCRCPEGHHAQKRTSTDGFNCVRNNVKRFSIKFVTFLGGGILIGSLCLLLLVYKLRQILKKRRHRLQKEKYFKQNGGFLLQQKLTANGGSKQQVNIFTAEELLQATDNFSQSRFLGQGGFGTVYKGMLPDGSVVAIKRSKAIGRNQIEQFINEVVVLSRVNHRNIVKLLGCCLETETPLLVYEFICNGTISHHIHNHEKDPESFLSWGNRFGIACDVSGALAYMHSSASMPIFHRDIKSSNILLDDKYNAKISDFGTSRSVPHDKTHLTTAVQGTLGYMDPEYFQSSQFTDKSDVYSFGVTLVELLTGENPFSFAEHHEGKNLITTFISMTKENQLSPILDPQVATDAGEEDIRAIAELATRCLRLNGKKRPDMKRVSMELEGLRKRETILETDIEPQSLTLCLVGGKFERKEKGRRKCYFLLFGKREERKEKKLNFCGAHQKVKNCFPSDLGGIVRTS